MAILYVMVGVPGSGKSTFAKLFKKKNKDILYLSRDEIRFSLLKEGDTFFSKEDEVYKQLWDRTTAALKRGYDVIVDQTSLTPRSRKYLLDHIDGYNKVIAVWVNTPLDQCIKNNEIRKGNKTYVPKEQMEKFARNFSFPKEIEGFNEIWVIDYNELTKEIREDEENDILNF